MKKLLQSVWCFLCGVCLWKGGFHLWKKFVNFLPLFVSYAFDKSIAIYLICWWQWVRHIKYKIPEGFFCFYSVCFCILVFHNSQLSEFSVLIFKDTIRYIFIRQITKAQLKNAMGTFQLVHFLITVCKLAHVCKENRQTVKNEKFVSKTTYFCSRKWTLSKAHQHAYKVFFAMKRWEQRQVQRPLPALASRHSFITYYYRLIPFGVECRAFRRTQMESSKSHSVYFSHSLLANWLRICTFHFYPLFSTFPFSTHLFLFPISNGKAPGASGKQMRCKHQNCTMRTITRCSGSRRRKSNRKMYSVSFVALQTISTFTPSIPLLHTTAAAVATNNVAKLYIYPPIHPSVCVHILFSNAIYVKPNKPKLDASSFEQIYLLHSTLPLSQGNRVVAITVCQNQHKRNSSQVQQQELDPVMVKYSSLSL